MNHEDLWAAIDAQRLSTVAFLEGLGRREWQHQSLCAGWTVRDVAAHLTLQQMTIRQGLRLALRHPGPLNQMILKGAQDKATLPTEQLIAEIGAMVGSRRHNTGLTPQETLIDIVVHGQDMAVPLGRTLEVPPDVAATAASRAWSYQLSRSGRRKAKVFRQLPWPGHRLVATDTDWAVGEGPEITGPVVSLLLLLTGRAVVVPQLGGTGAAALLEVER